MRTFFHLCLTALLSTVILSAVEPDPLSFFPHHVGDTWVYQYYHGEPWIKIIHNITQQNDTIHINYGLTELPHFITEPIKVYLPLDKSTRLLYKLDALENETWIVQQESDQQSRIDAIVQDVYKTIVLGKLTTVKKISYFRLAPEEPHITDSSWYMYTHWLASGIGLVQTFLEGSSEPEFVLTGCIINGDTLGIVTDVEEQQNVQPLSVAVSPNPCSLFANIRCTLPPGVTVAHLTITDIFGNSVYTADIDNDQYTIDTSILPNGLYFCTLTVGVQLTTSRLIVYK